MKKLFRFKTLTIVFVTTVVLLMLYVAVVPWRVAQMIDKFN